jgi:hypothetical protein
LSKALARSLDYQEIGRYSLKAYRQKALYPVVPPNRNLRFENISADPYRGPGLCFSTVENSFRSERRTILGPSGLIGTPSSSGRFPLNPNDRNYARHGITFQIILSVRGSSSNGVELPSTTENLNDYVHFPTHWKLLSSAAASPFLAQPFAVRFFDRH